MTNFRKNLTAIAVFVFIVGLWVFGSWVEGGLG